MRWNAGLAVLAASWGAIAVLASAVDLDAEPLAFLRLLLAAATLAAVAVATGRARLLLPRGRLGALVVLGIVQGAHWVLFFETVKHGSVALAVLTFASAPLAIALAAPLVLPERPSRVVLLSLLPVAAGVALLTRGDGAGGGAAHWAVAAGLGSALTYALLVILSKRLLLGTVAPLTVAFWDCAVGAVAVAPTLLLAPRVIPVDAGDWSRVLVLGILLTGLSTLAYALLLRHVTAQAAGVLTFLEPVSGILLAWLLLAERPGTATVVGGVLVLAAGVAVVVSEPAHTGVAETPAGLGSGA